MDDDEIQEAVTIFMIRLARRSSGADFPRVLLRVAGLVSAFYIEYMRDMRRRKRPA